MSTTGGRFCRGLLAGTIFALAIPSALPLLPAQNADLPKMRRIAEAEHDIVMILIKKREFAQAAEEANKIFQMNWPEDQEQMLKDELLRFTDLFRHNGQPAIAVQLLETNLRIFKAPKVRAEILKDKGYMLEAMGQHDKAIECFREAKELETVKDPQQKADPGKKKEPCRIPSAETTQSPVV